MNDLRIATLAKPAASDGEYRGMENGALNQLDFTITSCMGAKYRERQVSLKM